MIFIYNILKVIFKRNKITKLYFNQEIKFQIINKIILLMKILLIIFIEFFGYIKFKEEYI